MVVWLSMGPSEKLAGTKNLVFSRHLNNLFLGTKSNMSVGPIPRGGGIQFGRTMIACNLSSTYILQRSSM